LYTVPKPPSPISIAPLKLSLASSSSSYVKWCVCGLWTLPDSVSSELPLERGVPPEAVYLRSLEDEVILYGLLLRMYRHVMTARTKNSTPAAMELAEVGKFRRW